MLNLRQLFAPSVMRLLLVVGSMGVVAMAANAETNWQAGFARVDVTPTEPVRMSGYGNRNRPSEGIDTPLFVRCMALRHRLSDESPLIMLTIDTVGVSGEFTRGIAESIEKKHGIPRERIVLCSTHTHSAPALVSHLSNIFSTSLTEIELAAAERYESQLTAGIVRATDLAIGDLSPASLSYEVGEATFASNRRVLSDGKWTGFGVDPDGPVDHSVPVLRIADEQQKLRGVVFNYACHATTLGGEHYKINAEWCGYACEHLESSQHDAVALCTIGCGADANPNPRDSIDAAKVHGRTLAVEVERLLGRPMREVNSPVSAVFDYAALSFDLPTENELNSLLSDARPQTKRLAESLLKTYETEGRLPATYPVPIQSWKFGDQLSMIFIGGEVVADYAIRLKKQTGEPRLWVTAYANDVLGYIASERVRQEGGYEVDRSAIYYGLPGPWAAGTEDLLIGRIEELRASKKQPQALPADETLRTIRVPEGMRIELVAAEPTVQDPVNIAFGADGKLWVVEMGDYPEGENGGCVKWLVDNDRDGRFETATVFLSDLSYPTGVFPWRDGVLISVAPDILFAKDSDGDGKADLVEKLYTGFDLANPQHRINGFTYGLDHSWHLASGDNLKKITSVVTAQVVNASGHDIQIWPDEGRIAATSGRTQFVRDRNDWGEWFGNDNSRPMFHFPIDDRYLKRNPAAKYSQNAQQLFDPPVAPPVFPVTAATTRFNDLFTANRFTSACSAIVARTPHFQVQSAEVAFICEPVHNLVHRSMLVATGSSYRAIRCEAEKQCEFLTSSDPWFRPVRACIGPDGMLWIVDMYRQTIEHPDWIPQSWQKQLDLRAGSDRGRIYRVTVDGIEPKPFSDFSRLDTEQLVQELRSTIGTVRDLAQQTIIERQDPAATKMLIELALDQDHPQGRVHALSILDLMSQLSDETLLSALQDSHPGVLLVAIRLTEGRLKDSPSLFEALRRAGEHADLRVVLHTALTLGQSDDPIAAETLGQIACRPDIDDWIVQAILSSAAKHSEAILNTLLERLGSRSVKWTPATQSLLMGLLSTAQHSGVDVAEAFADRLTQSSVGLGQQIELASTFCRTLRSKDSNSAMSNRFTAVYAQAIDLIADSSQDQELRCQAIEMTGLGIGEALKERELLLGLIDTAAPTSIQQRSIDGLFRIDADQACQAIIAKWPSMTQAVREHFVSNVLLRPGTVNILFDALESGSIKVSELSLSTRQQLTQAGPRSLRVRAARLVRTSGDLAKSTLIRSYLSEMKGAGDAETGAELFKQHCAACHVPDRDGKTVGATLENLTDRGDEALLTAILDPNRAVDPKYQTYFVETQDGRILAGAIENEVGSSIAMAHADGKRTVINRNEIAEIKNSGVSLMPEGMENLLPPQSMRDLLAHLQRR